MELNMPTFPFEVSLDVILQDSESYVDAVFSCLESEFLVLPRGAGFVEYPVFERGYEALKVATAGFSQFDPNQVFSVTVSEPIAIVVLRSILGFTPRSGLTSQHREPVYRSLRASCARWTERCEWPRKRNLTPTALPKNGSKRWFKQRVNYCRPELPM